MKVPHLFIFCFTLLFVSCEAIDEGGDLTNFCSPILVFGSIKKVRFPC